MLLTNLDDGEYLYRNIMLAVIKTKRKFDHKYLYLD